MGQEGEEAHSQLEMLGVTERKLIKSGCLPPYSRDVRICALESL